MRRLAPNVRAAAWRFMALPLAAWLLVICGGGAGLAWANRDAHRDLEHRFQLRVLIAAQFVSTFVGDLVNRERDQARRFLADPVVPRATFEQTVTTFGYPAAVLIDDHGRVIHVEPPSPDLVGRDLTAQYAHLRDALRFGEPVVSGVVPSAVVGSPVVALAVPYNTLAGRRVFSGAIDVRSSPLGNYLRHAIALRDSQVFLIDRDGVVVGSNSSTLRARSTLRDRRPDLAAELARAPNGRYGDSVDGGYYASEYVAGTSWRIVADVPTPVLYEPVEGAINWSLAGLAVTGLVGLVSALVAGRNARNRALLRVSEGRFRGLFDSSLIGMALVDTDSRVLRTNLALCDMLGYPEAELVGRRMWDLTHPDDHNITEPLVAETVAGQRSGFSVEKRYVRADGEVVYASLTSALLRDERGRPVHFALQIADITERRRLAEAQLRSREELASRARELEAANNRLAAASSRLADLMAMLTHDVRQPLGVISGYCEVLLEDWNRTDDRTKRRDVTRIAHAGTAMMQLVEEILTMTQVDSDSLSARRTAIEVGRAVEQAVAALYAEPGGPIEVDFAELAGLDVLADPRHLHQILVNLLSNARKYGRPPVRVAVRRADGAAEVAVSDEGEGVPPDFVPLLFDRFTRASTGVAPTHKGTGLGLYIVDQLARANGGAVRYEPNQPRGSRFVVSVPLAPHDRSLGQNSKIGANVEV